MADVKIFAKTIEQEAIDQINILAAQASFVNEKIRIMPDCHAGKGCTVGFTSTYTDKVIPFLCGVDLSCGMAVYELGKVDINLQILDEIINNWFNLELGQAHAEPQAVFNFSQLRMYKYLNNEDYLIHSLGTVGNGNHFIELNKDDNGNIYLVIHSGSRNLGLQVANYYQQLAILNVHKQQNNLNEIKQNLIKEYKEQGRQKEIQQALRQLNEEYSNFEYDIPNDLCYLEGQDLQDYLHDIQICAAYAHLNRSTIASIIIEEYYKKTGVYLTPLLYWETLHNYINITHKIIRKGAIAAYQGEKVLIPLNMRDGSIIAVGKGNEDWNCSAPHGAGRLMSRSKAKEILNMEDYNKSMEGIYTTSIVESTIDEAPMAYKPSEEIIELVKDTVDIIKIIKPIYNFKVKGNL